MLINQRQNWIHMTGHIVVHFKKECISCGACAAISPEYWEMDEEGMAQLKKAVPVNDHWERQIETEEARAANQEAADCCPVSIIKVKKN